MNAALSSIDRASELMNSEDKALEDTGDDEDRVCPITSTFASEVFLVDADWPKENHLLEAFKPSFRDSHGFLRCFHVLV